MFKKKWVFLFILSNPYEIYECKKRFATPIARDGHDFDFKIKIMIFKSKSWFSNQNHDFQIKIMIFKSKSWFSNQNHDFQIKIMIFKSISWYSNQNHDLILILNHLIFSYFYFKSSRFSIISILKRIQNQNHFMISYYN